MQMFGDDFELERQANDLLKTANRKGKRGKPSKTKSRTAQKLTGMVEAKCSKCGDLSKIPADSWSCEGIENKPKCHCGGLVYLADSSSVVVCLGTTYKGKFYPAKR